MIICGDNTHGLFFDRSAMAGGHERTRGGTFGFKRGSIPKRRATPSLGTLTQKPKPEKNKTTKGEKVAF